ncbi:hypothetical protein AGMMS49992_08680 [Clostridia bacterium]|nr:hypothetical protein AGMMS49992_08680 [Clostridia bacterium]
MPLEKNKPSGQQVRDGMAFTVHMVQSSSAINGYYYKLIDVSVPPGNYASISIKFPPELTVNTDVINAWLTARGNHSGSPNWYAVATKDGYFITAYMNPDTGNPYSFASAAEVQSLLQSLEFTFRESGVFPAKATVDVSAETKIISNMEIDGSMHYYEFINAAISWTAAYNLAKQKTYRGMTGYLATITSNDEQYFIYDTIAKIPGWLGGTRASFKINNEGSFVRIDDNASIGSIDAISINYDGCDWYWACGPEHGKVFLESCCQRARPDPCTEVMYNNWNLPNEPNNSGSEAFLEFAHSQSFWNDFANTKTIGYYVEYGGYPSDQPPASGENEATEHFPQPVYVAYRYTDTTSKLATNPHVKGADVDANGLATQIVNLGNYDDPYTVDLASYTPTPSQIPTGYRFVGIKKVTESGESSEGGGEETVSRLQSRATATGTITDERQYYVFLFEPITYKVTLVSEDPDVPNTTINVKYNQQFVNLPPPARLGYDCAWYDSSGNVVTRISVNEQASSQRFYAQCTFVGCPPGSNFFPSNQNCYVNIKIAPEASVWTCVDLSTNSREYGVFDSNGELVSTATPTRNGRMSFDKLMFANPGQYVYTIRQLCADNAENDAACDTREYKMVVTVRRYASGKFGTRVKYYPGVPRFR